MSKKFQLSGSCDDLLDASKCARSPPTLQLVGVQRFLTDMTFARLVPAAAYDDVDDAFDITVSDGECRLKCLLSPTLGRAVRTGHLVSAPACV